MSWNGYIDSVIGGSKGNCDKVIIIGLEGGAHWTTADHASHWKLTAQEGVDIAKAMKNDDYTTFQAKGIILESVKFQFLRNDPDEGLALGKKKDQGSVTIQKSNTAIIIAHTTEGKVQGDTNSGVLAIVNYLKGVNM